MPPKVTRAICRGTFDFDREDVFQDQAGNEHEQYAQAPQRCTDLAPALPPPQLAVLLTAAWIEVFHEIEEFEEEPNATTLDLSSKD